MDSLLDQIQYSFDVKKLDSEEMDRLCQEIGKRFFDRFQKRRHLASNLGVVELTLALHYAFDFPRDKLVWDVGHQSYAHKLLTEEGVDFHTLSSTRDQRFSEEGREPYDTFDSGHSGTSISAGLGMAEALRHRDEGGKWSR